MTALLRWIVAGCLIVFALFVVNSLITGTTHGGKARWMLTMSVIIAGGSLIVADLSAPREKAEKIAGGAGVGVTIAAAIVSFLLIWTELITKAHLWRTWWVLSGLSLTTAHVLLVRLAVADAPWKLWLRRITLGSIAIFATFVISLTFRRDILSMPPAALAIPIWIALAGETIGSLALWIWCRPAPQPITVPWRAFRWGWYLASPVLLIGVGFYLGRVTTPGEGIFHKGAGALAGLDGPTIDAQVKTDLARLRGISQGVEQLRAKSLEARRDVVGKIKKEGRTVFTPEEDDAIRSLFFTYLSYRTALHRMIAYYQGFEGVEDPARRKRCFLVAYAAGTICYDASLSVVAMCHDDPLVRDKLNEPEVKWGIPAGMFDRVHESVALEKNVELFEEMTAYYQERRSEWKEAGLEAGELRWLDETLEHGIASVRMNALYGKGVPLRLIVERVKKDAYKPVYAFQSAVSTWIGDTRLVTKLPGISRRQIDELRGKMQPGDIILERRNWFLSNAFLPGFWPHAELYVGTAEQLQQLGLHEEPEVKKRWEEFTTAAKDGDEHCIIESISEGVAFSSLGEGCRADYIVVLRPKVPVEAKKKAILRAFAHVGKPYDFEFDFFSADKLVCTEVVYRAYEGTLHFDLVKIMGRMTLPALEMARKFNRERGTPKQELEFVVFLDTPRGGSEAVWASEEEFVGSAERPRAFSE